MVSFKNLAIIALGTSDLLSSTFAHPGEHLTSLQLRRQSQNAQAIAKRAADKFARCANSERAIANRKRSAARRAAKVAALKKRGLKRDSTQTEAYDDGSHNETGVITTGQAFSVNTSCILEPIVTIGPYWVEGELIREDLTDGEEGVPMQLELEFLNVNTCEPYSGLYIDIWHANATGYYSGIAESGLDTTFLRGIQVTDADGVVSFDTLVAGHYEGRAVHTHLMVHENVSLYDNSTYYNGTVRSISQLFYETALQEQVEATSPYSSNTASVTTNTDDSILNSITDESYDPFLKYIYLGSSISDGIFAFHSIGIDPSADYDSQQSAAAHYYETGGVANADSAMGGGSGGPSGNSTGGPGGAPPSGAMPPGTGMPGAFSSGAISGSSTVVADAASTTSVSSLLSMATSKSSSVAKGTHGSSVKSMTSLPKSSGTQPTHRSSVVANIEASNGPKADQHDGASEHASAHSAGHSSGHAADRASSHANGAAPTAAPSVIGFQNDAEARDGSYSKCG